MISPKDEAWTERDVHKSETALLSFQVCTTIISIITPRLQIGDTESATINILNCRVALDGEAAAESEGKERCAVT